MIKTVEIKNPNGEILSLNLRNSSIDVGLLIFNIEGLGPPKATVNGSAGPNFDGIRASTVRADSRHILMTLAVVPGGGDLEEDARQRIYHYLPIKQEVLVHIISDRKDVVINAIVESNEFNQFAKVENAVISLLCPDPYFWDIASTIINVSDVGGIPNFQFPFSNESLVNPLLEFGFVTDLPTAEISYPGEVKTGIDITLNIGGAIEDIVITNNNGSQQMTIDTTDLEPTQAGDQIIIDTRIGQKNIQFVRSSVFTNIINAVGIEDDWIDLRPGSNRVIVDATSGIDDIETTIEYRPLREGI